MTKELNALAETAKTSDDPYFLVAGRAAAATAAARRRRRRSRRSVAKLQKDDGHARRGRRRASPLGRPRPADRDDGPGGAGLAEGQPGAFDAPVRTGGPQWIGQQRGGYGGVRLDAVHDPGAEGA